jgi:hypothetical protein
VLDRVRAGALADAGQCHLALVAVERRGADLDQPVRRDGALDLGDHCVGQPLFPQLQDRVEAVRACFEGLAFGRGEFVFHARRILAQQMKRPGIAPGPGPAQTAVPLRNRT